MQVCTSSQITTLTSHHSIFQVEQRGIAKLLHKRQHGVTYNTYYRVRKGKEEDRKNGREKGKRNDRICEMDRMEGRATEGRKLKAKREEKEKGRCKGEKKVMGRKEKNKRGKQSEEK